MMRNPESKNYSIDGIVTLSLLNGGAKRFVSWSAPLVLHASKRSSQNQATASCADGMGKTAVHLTRHTSTVKPTHREEEGSHHRSMQRRCAPHDRKMACLHRCLRAEVLCVSCWRCCGGPSAWLNLTHAIDRRVQSWARWKAASREKKDRITNTGGGRARGTFIKCPWCNDYGKTEELLSELFDPQGAASIR